MAYPGRNVRAGQAGAGNVRNTNLAVGLFVSSALAMFLAVTVWLSGRQGTEATVIYSMYFQNDVSGLMMGGPVFYLGVEVGNVIRMEIIPGNPMSVRVDVEVLETTPIDTGTSASLVFQGITQRDLIVVKSVIFLLVFAVILVTFLVDITYAIADPRLRRGRS